ncbi:hypothetical protein SBRCBS47491_007969 [Sporothrix bragantina]|uniref:MARVEL domain-containing protein n=1 Tax=Sporothrix bragantina TaxID=671064 RepID=A0ABP0CHN0_9PEZI
MASNYASPVHGDGGTPGSYPVFPMPVAVIVARGFQIFISLLIMVMAGLLMHGLVLSAYAFAFACGFLTLIIALYAILSEKVSACRAGYNYWAVFSLDLLMIIFWLASMGANAALRGTFKYTTEAECFDDGSTFNAGTCYTSKRDGVISKRYAVAGKVALAEISAIAGLSAVQMLLFAATFGYLAHQVRLHLQAQKQGIQSDDAAVVEMKGQPGGRVSSAAVYDPDAPLPASSLVASGHVPVQPYSAQAYAQPMPYSSAAYSGAAAPAQAGYAQAGVYGGQPTNVYDPQAQAQSAAYAAAAQPVVSPAATPAPAYPGGQNALPTSRYTTAVGPQHTPEPYYSTDQTHQAYYPSHQ